MTPKLREGGAGAREARFTTTTTASEKETYSTKNIGIS
jgi:hypothetical protein